MFLNFEEVHPVATKYKVILELEALVKNGNPTTTVTARIRELRERTPGGGYTFRPPVAQKRFRETGLASEILDKIRLSVSGVRDQLYVESREGFNSILIRYTDPLNPQHEVEKFRHPPRA